MPPITTASTAKYRDRTGKFYGKDAGLVFLKWLKSCSLLQFEPSVPLRTNFWCVQTWNPKMKALQGSSSTVSLLRLLEVWVSPQHHPESVRKKDTHKKYRTNNRRLDGTPKKQALQARIAAGSSLSVVSTSLLNRFSTRPSGVMSKNVVSGARSTFRSSRWCRIRDALRAPTYRASVVNRTVTTVSHRQHTNTQRRNYARKGRRDMVWYTDIYKRREDYPK